MDSLGTGKTQASLIGAFISTIVIWALDTYVLHPPMPDFVATAVTGLICAGCTYFTSHSASVTNLIPGKGQ